MGNDRLAFMSEEQ